MNTQQTKAILIVLIALSSIGTARASLVTCISSDGKVSVGTSKKDKPTPEGDTDLAQIDIAKHESVFVNMHGLTLGDDLLMVNAIDYFAPRNRFKLTLGKLTPTGIYPNSKLVLNLPSKLNGDYTITPAETLEFDLSCSVSPDRKFINVCKPSNPTAYNAELLAASSIGDIDAAQQAVACGAAVNSANVVGCTPLMLSLSASDRECVAAGTPTPPLDLLRWKKGAGLLEFLLGAGASTTAQDQTGETILHKAVKQGFPNEVPRLVAYGADLNQPDAGGNTPLMTSASTGYVFGVVALLDAGADVTKKNLEGKTALDLAEHMPESIIARLSGTASDGIVIQGSATGCSPLAITIPMGNTAKITLKSDANNMFILKLPELGLDLMSAPDSSVSQNIKTDSMGTYNFQCGVHGGDMVTGKLTITM